MSDNAQAPDNTTPTPAGHSLPFRGGELNQVLDGMRNRGPDTYARALRLAVDDGYTLPAEHQKAFAALRSDAGHVPSPAQGKAMTDAEEFDNSSLAPARDIADYRINWRGLVDPDSPEITKMDTNMRTALHQMQLPASIGGTIAEYGWRDAEKFAQLDATGREAYVAEQNAQLARFFPDVPKAVKEVDALVARIADKELAQRMADAGFFNSARVVVLLHGHAQRMAARRAMK